MKAALESGQWMPAHMMALPANTRVWIAAGVTDLRRGFTGLSALVETKLEQKPFSGHVFVFRGRRGHGQSESSDAPGAGIWQE